MKAFTLSPSKVLHAGLLSMCALTSLNTVAAEGGYSNYVPGTYGDFGMALAPVEEWTVRNDIYNYSADINGSVRNGQVELNASLDFTYNLTTVLYNPDVELLGATYAFGAVLPYVNADISASIASDGLSQTIKGESNGFGDIALIPVALYWQSGNMHYSFSEIVVAPTGDYDVNNAINNSLNYWSFDTNFATTYLNPETGQDYSINVGYTYNTENEATQYQSGQEVHVDIALNQFLSESFAIGIHGFYLNQITDDKGVGAELDGFRGKAYGAGPAMMWMPKVANKDFVIVAKWLKEFEAEHRLEGDHVMLSVAFDW